MKLIIFLAGIGLLANLIVCGQESGSFTDIRDGQEYRWVKIGEATWMAENLNFEVAENSWCYNDSEDSCKKYGRLYNWAAAQIACPEGWYLPSGPNWKGLAVAVSKIHNYHFIQNNEGWPQAGYYLKSIEGWGNEGNGVDSDGFTVLPAGIIFEGKFMRIGRDACFWTSTPYSDKKINTILFSPYGDGIYYQEAEFTEGNSIRCIKETPSYF